MSRDQDFTDLYQEHRFEDQRGWYERRRKEFEAALRQVVTLSALFMFLTSATAGLAVTEILGVKGLWEVLVVAFPALATAIAAYNGLYAFQRHAKLYQDAANALLRTRAKAPDLTKGLSDAKYKEALDAYVSEAENILRKEQGQWGQMISEIAPAQPTD